ncbi:MAG: hypothetical protein R6X34_08235 [Chloroflexota bacterium]
MSLLKRHGLPLLLLTLVTFVVSAFFVQAQLSRTGGELGAPLDDAWIHFQFARNLSQGHGFSFNPGEPTPGSTAPLWTVLLAGVGLFTQDFMAPAIFLSGVFLLASVWLSYGFTVDLTGSRAAGLLAGLALALSGRFVWAGLAAMETTAFAALSLGAVWFYTRRGLTGWSALLFALASQVRPEGHALFALAGLDAVMAYWRAGLRGGMVKRLLAPLLVYGLVSLPYVAFSLSTTGKPLANTFYAKVGSEHFWSWRTFRETARFHWFDNVFAFVFMLLGLLPAWRRSRLTVLWLVGLPLLTAVIIDQTWHHGRYTMPLIPFQMIVAAVGVDWLARKIRSSFSVPRSPLIVYVLAAALVVLSGFWQLGHWAQMYANNAKEILDIDVALGRWLAANTPPDALIAVDDIGAIAFLSERRILDMNGLVSPEMWPAVRQPVGLPRDQVALRELAAADADYLAVFPKWHVEIHDNKQILQPVFSVNTETHTIIFQPEAVVYRTDWPYRQSMVPDTELTAALGDSIRLRGFDWRLVEDRAELTVYWESITAVPDSYKVFIHIMDENGNIVAQVDRPPVNGLAPTRLWQPGDQVRDMYQIPLPPGLPPGAYEVRVGLYTDENGRLPASGGDVVDNAVVVTRFKIED